MDVPPRWALTHRPPHSTTGNHRNPAIPFRSGPPPAPPAIVCTVPRGAQSQHSAGVVLSWWPMASDVLLSIELLHGGTT